LHFRTIRGLHPSLTPSLKGTLCWYAQNCSSRSVSGTLGLFRRFFRAASQAQGSALRIITDVDVANVRSTICIEDDEPLSRLRRALRTWHELGYRGVDDSAIKYLYSLRLRRRPHGQAVLTMDPLVGPFTDVEFEALQHAITDAWGMGTLGLRDYVAAWLFMLLGARPVQLAALKVSDLHVTDGPDGSSVYMLRVPRAKQHVQPLRAEFKWRPIIPQVGELLTAYAAEVRRTFARDIPNTNDVPLFPSDTSSALCEAGYEWHATAGLLASHVQRALRPIAPVSERTGKPIAITMTRFRRTLATRAAMEGHGARVIAELLDHSNTDNVRIYVEARPEIAQRITKAIAFKLAPLARAFAGVVVTSPDETLPRVTDPVADRSMTRPVGSCGTTSTCGFAAPVACYTCRSFRPWVEGPHDAVLERLLEERRSLLARTDSRIASVNDRTILAVAQVVLLCRNAKQARQEHG
jgi:integrase